MHLENEFKWCIHYGAQIGEGGMEMRNDSRVQRNIYSNGSVIASTGTGYIDNSIVVARNGNRIEGLDVGDDAEVYQCVDSQIGDKLTFNSSGGSNCSAPFPTPTTEEIQPKTLPISQTQVQEWENDAFTKGGSVALSTNYLLTNGDTDNLGPKQIGTPATPKNLTVNNGAHLIIRGTIYVTGDILFDNNVTIELDRNIYGSISGVIIADGKITVQNNAVLRGSGETGSYLLILSTNDSLSASSPAIFVKNNAQGAILYTTSGLINVSNNVIAREITGYKINLENGAEIQYESGLENSLFSSGPGGGWKVASWKETE